MIEAIPNLSEGRDRAVIAELEDAVRSVPGILHLGTAPDPDHNRTVITYASNSAESLLRATIQLFEVAVKKIDLRVQKGEHPRVGAVDVLPFVPLGSAEMADCIDLARTAGREVSERFSVPVFLYEYAAKEDYRRALPAIRSGGLAKLGRRMATEEWRPDYGPEVPHPSAGVSVIGARRPLIAFNVQLSSDNMDIAEEIARAVREIGGGLPAVRAIPIRLAERGIVQVSMNLLDYKRTSIWAAFNAVRREAAARGIEVLSTELIGLAPAEALLDAAAEAIAMENFSMNLVLENQIEVKQFKVQRSKVKE